MSRLQEVRRKARAWRGRLLGAGDEMSIAFLLGEAEQLTGVMRVPVPAGDTLLNGAEALLDAEAGVILFDQSAEPWRIAFYQAHEYAHLWLDGGHAACDDADMHAETSESGAGVVEGYGPHERREREANVFALELLLPTDLVRRWYLDERLDAGAIAARVGLPLALVFHQLTAALLLPMPSDQAEREPAARELPRLDASQESAARVAQGPLLLEAGPGTGKTRTLVARVLFLLEQGIPADNILALTFSNRAAEEMRERVAVVAPGAAAHLWTGTFHAFGLELLRKYGTRLGLPAKPAVLGTVDALLLLERCLPELQLDHYQNLNEPSAHLPDLLAAISRAKDELVSPDEYRALVQKMAAVATTQDEQEAAEKAGEVAHVYSFYQDRLRQEGLVDFGDLIMLGVTLLRQHPDVRMAVQRAYPQVLVDEYQDVNRASGLLLREIADDGAGLWVVGDARQAIYRFRGAAPINMRLFTTDFAGATVRRLERNYRSQPAIVSAVAELAARMRATTGAPFRPWQAERQAIGDAVLMEVASDEQSEIAGLAREIGRRRNEGIAYGEQAVLCRSHTALARVAQGLERAGVPVLYLGDLFERAEVRDMLSLLSFASEGNGHALVRVARFPEYAVPLADVQTLLELARQKQSYFPRALDLAGEAAEISSAGKRGLALLSAHLDGLCYGTSAWSMLSQYLFARSGYLRSLVGQGTTAAIQQGLALYQFLQFTYEQRETWPASSGDPKRAFLGYVRQLEICGEESTLRQAPVAAAQLDGVRLMTIHASKGLEFRAVYLPRLGQRYFPAPRQRRPCPPPSGMLAETDEHDEEEECLFFVAISRARDVLCLSRARRYGKQASRASSLLSLIEGMLPQPPGGDLTWGESIAAEGQEAAGTEVGGTGALFDVELLELYLGCPRRFFYDQKLSMGGGHDTSAYGRFHRCVATTVQWIRRERHLSRVVEEGDALARLRQIWEAQGPSDHFYEQIYRSNAEAMVLRALRRSGQSSRQVTQPEWEIKLPHGRVRLQPDQVEMEGKGATQTVVVQRVRTGKASAREHKKGIYALYTVAAAQAYPGSRPQVQTLSLSNDEVIDISLSSGAVATELQRYDGAISGILAGRFEPAPDDRLCPRCPHYFTCPAGPAD